MYRSKSIRNWWQKFVGKIYLDKLKKW
jgi:hypothetical protein